MTGQQSSTRKRADGELDREIKSHSLLEEQHEIEPGVREREKLTATKEKMSGGEKKKLARTCTTFPP